jgi:proline dehydrogenase
MLAEMIARFGSFFFLRIMKRWVAGASADDAVRYCSSLNVRGSTCLINFLGEHYKESSLAEAAVREYKRLVDSIKESGVRAAITLKPSQFGFNAQDADDSQAFCERNMLEVLGYASGRGLETWLDMEDSTTTDFTIAFYRKYLPKHRLGICLQANLKRTRKDLMDLSKMKGARVRLVKGIYQENGDIAFTDPKEIHQRFLELIKVSFEKTHEGFGVAVASHHVEAIELALGLQRKSSKRFFEIEVLKGVLPGYYGELRMKGTYVTEYVPYGPDAFAYSVRRAMKNPGFAKSMLYAPFFDAYRKLHGGHASGNKV